MYSHTVLSFLCFGYHDNEIEPKKKIGKFTKKSQRPQGLFITIDSNNRNNNNNKKDADFSFVQEN